MAVALGVLRRLPARPRRIAAGALIGAGRPLAHLPLAWRLAVPALALGLAARGRTADARAEIDKAVSRRRTPAGTFAGTALALGDPALAERLAGLPPEPAVAVAADGGAALVAAEARLARGSFTDARLLVEAYLDRYPADAYARRLARRIDGELRVRDPAWRPAIERATTRGAPVKGRVLHLLTNSLPDRQAGYTFRTHEIARSQLGVGLDPHLATRAGFPLWEIGRASCRERVSVVV